MAAPRRQHAWRTLVALAAGATHALATEPSSPGGPREADRVADGPRAPQVRSSKADEWVARLRAWRPRPAPVDDAPADWMELLPTIPPRAKVHSQANQDAVLMRVFDRVGVTNRYYVEFGFNSATYEGGSGANTLFLHEHGFDGLLLDSRWSNASINLHAHFLDRTNVARLFAQYGVPRAPDLVSCDMDSHDTFVLRAILEGGYRPRVIVTEFNVNWRQGDAFTLDDPTMLPGGPGGGYGSAFANCAWGASLETWRLLAAEFGYSIIHRVAALDVIWLRDDLVRGARVPAWQGLQRSFAMHCAAYPRDLGRLLDYRVWNRTRELEGARAAAMRTLRSRYAKHPCTRHALEAMAGSEAAMRELAAQRERRQCHTFSR